MLQERDGKNSLRGIHGLLFEFIIKALIFLLIRLKINLYYILFSDREV
jgi:hypothetical protein